MTDQVIPLILSEHDCRVLGEHWVLKLLNCTTSGVIYQLNAYLDKGGTDPDVEELICKFYAAKRNEMGLSNDSMQSSIEKIESLRLDTPFVYYTVEELEALNNSLQSVLSSARESVAYNLPISSKLFKSVIKEIKENGTGEQHDIAARIEKHPAHRIFYDPANARARKTMYKRVILNNTVMELIANGVKFLLEQATAGVQPPQWRHL